MSTVPRLARIVACAAFSLVACGTNTTDEVPRADPPLELPQQTLLSSSMREKPVPGWQVTIDELGLPPRAGVTPLTHVDDHGVFLGITGEAWSVLGIDLSSGRRTFGPVPLGPADSAVSVDCYVNGPPTVLCVRDSVDPATPSTATVIDTASGEVTYAGPTAARADLLADEPHVEQVGDHAVAVAGGEGVHGIGPRGELTWFVPGDGVLPARFADESDSPAPALTTQHSTGMASVVFSPIDGTVVKPELPQDTQLGLARVYPGGFAYEYVSGNDFATERVAFFDETGHRLAEPEPGGRLTPDSVDLPVVASKEKYRLFTIDGRQLLTLPPTPTAPEARLIGSQWFYSADGAHTEWQQVDLDTGQAGETCDGLDLGADFIASDGHVVIASGDGTLARAIDAATCETLWRIDGSAPPTVERLWRVDATLVQRTDDTLFSLVAPS